jgi:hypothetical protein
MRNSLLILALIAAAPAWAGTTNRDTIRLSVEGMPPASALEGDPNIMICTRQHMIGSRLHAGQVCKTRGEWVAQREDMRSQLASGQFRQTNPNGEGSSSGQVGMFQPCTAAHGC